MEQVLERLLVEMRETRESVKANKEAMVFCLKKMVAKMDAWLGETKACREATKASLEKTEATVKVGQEEMRAEIKTGLGEIKATESKVNQEKIEVGAEHCDPVPRIIPTNVLTALQGWASDAVRGAPNDSTFEKRRRTWSECSNGIRDRGLKRQLHLGGKTALNETLRQTLKLEIVMLVHVVGSSIRLQRTSDWAL
jgi:hypothetical protein